MCCRRVRPPTTHALPPATPLSFSRAGSTPTRTWPPSCGRLCARCVGQQLQTRALLNALLLQGSIKDMIYACPKDWKNSYIQKYTAKRGTPLPEKQVASFSRQILEGMMFLERKGWPYQVVSTGNVLLSRSQSQCHLCDIESAILDVPPRIAPLVSQNSPPSLLAAVTCRAGTSGL